jgi:hypothetical protein
MARFIEKGNWNDVILRNRGLNGLGPILKGKISFKSSQKSGSVDGSSFQPIEIEND